MIDPDCGPATVPAFADPGAHTAASHAATRLALQAQEDEPERVEVLTHLARCRADDRPAGSGARARDRGPAPCHRDNPVVLDSLGDGADAARRAGAGDRAVRPGRSPCNRPRLAVLQPRRGAEAVRTAGQRPSATSNAACSSIPRTARRTGRWPTCGRTVPRTTTRRGLRAQLDTAAPGSGQEEMLSLVAVQGTRRPWAAPRRPGPCCERGIASRRDRWLAAGQDPRAATDALLRLCDDRLPGASAGAHGRAAAVPDRHAGLGRGAARPAARRAIEACTTSAAQQPFSRLLSLAIGRDSTRRLRCRGLRALRLRWISSALGARYLAEVTPASGRAVAGLRKPSDEFPAGRLHRAGAAAGALPARDARPGRQLRVDPRASGRRSQPAGPRSRPAGFVLPGLSPAYAALGPHAARTDDGSRLRKPGRAPGDDPARSCAPSSACVTARRCAPA